MPLRMGLWIIALVLPQSNALPVERLEHVARTLGTRQTSTSNEASPKIIVPVVIGVIVAIMIVAFGWWKRRKRTREVINQVRNASNTATNATPARTNNTTTSAQAPTAAPGTGADAPARPPRRRRRRRPSQISTKSLPAYNEQAGDEEIVLVRRNERDSMSDDDYEDESNINHRSANATSTTADAVPLLDDSSPDMPRVSLASSTHGQSPTDHSRTSTSPTTTNDPNVTTGVPSIVEPETPETSAPQDIPPSPHPDDVPAYDEAVASTPNLAASTSSTAPEQTQTPEASTSSHIRQSTGGSGPPADGDAHNTIRPKRKSVFRQFFALNRQGSTSEAPPESVELGANPRPSMTLSVASARTQSNHRPSASVSTIASGGTSGRGHALSPSLSSLILTRSRSPTRSTDSLAQRLNISAPISTTLVRTEISYPRAGPTPEQIRFLSSRESLGRFGMPYGEEAIAAARSRENLSTLPPQYETGESQGTDAGNTQPARGPMFYTPGELALRTETSAASPERTQTSSGQIQLEAEQAKPSTEQTLSESAQTPSESAQIQSEPERIEPGPEPTAVEQHQDESNASASSQSAHLRRFSIASTTAPDANRRESVYTTHSFVTATEGEDTAESDNYSDAESSPPTPTASTYREFGVRPRGQTVLVPESDRALHPELILLPATPTSTLSSRRASPT